MSMYEEKKVQSLRVRLTSCAKNSTNIPFECATNTFRYCSSTSEIDAYMYKSGSEQAKCWRWKPAAFATTLRRVAQLARSKGTGRVADQRCCWKWKKNAHTPPDELNDLLYFRSNDSRIFFIRLTAFNRDCGWCEGPMRFELQRDFPSLTSFLDPRTRTFFSLVITNCSQNIFESTQQKLYPVKYWICQVSWILGN